MTIEQALELLEALDGYGLILTDADDLRARLQDMGYQAERSPAVREGFRLFRTQTEVKK